MGISVGAWCQHVPMKVVGFLVRVLLICSLFLAAIAAFASNSLAYADSGWVAVASSPTHESLDWSVSAGQDAAESTALRHCAVLQDPFDCQILASGPNCVAVAWDSDEPLNRPHGAIGDTPAAALNAAVAAAGSFANDPVVRCSYQQFGPATPPADSLPQRIA